jgi:hypothetical protein
MTQDQVRRVKTDRQRTLDRERRESGGDGGRSACDKLGHSNAGESVDRDLQNLPAGGTNVTQVFGEDQGKNPATDEEDPVNGDSPDLSGSGSDSAGDSDRDGMPDFLGLSDD